MKIGKQITVFAGGVREEAPVDKRKGDASDKPAKTVYAGDVRNSFDLKSRVEHRKGMAQNQAKKIVRDTWNGDRKLDRELEQLDQHTAELRQTIREQLVTIQDVAGQKEELRSIYGISDEEMEMMDQYGKSLMGQVKLTEEEKEYYQKITDWYGEYRRRVWELDTVAGESRKTIAKAKMKIYNDCLVAKVIREERLKVHPMLDAQKKTEKVMEAVTEDVVGMVVDDAREQIDKQQEEREEKAEKIKEEKEVREEILEERREKDEELERLMEDIPLEQMPDGGSSQVQMRQQLMEIQNKIEMEVQQQILEIQNQMSASVEEFKSLMVDIQI